MNFWAWMSDHYFLGAILVYSTLQVVLFIVNRILRTIKVLVRGWPPHSLMDADGDIVHPEVAPMGTTIEPIGEGLWKIK